MSVGELADMLERRMSMLTVGSRGRTSRHRSLQATIDWSYELCSAASNCCGRGYRCSWAGSTCRPPRR